MACKLLFTLSWHRMRLFPAAVLMFLASTAQAATPYLVKEVNTGVTVGSYPSSLTDVNGTLFFTANEPGTGTELWKSDGTSAGTVRVADINAGPASSGPAILTAVGNTVYFSACSGDTTAQPDAANCELWKSDGTGAGTVQVADINPGSASSYPGRLARLNDRVYFTATEPVGGLKLWTSDGTPEGTRRVVDLTLVSGGSYVSRLIPVNGILYFALRGADDEDGYPRAALWRSDGTAEGTVRVDGVEEREEVGDLTRVGNALYFTMCAQRACELWKTDGTLAGTGFVTSIGPSYGDDDTDRPPFDLTSVTLADAGGRLFFRPNTYDCELWTTDGTSEGSVKLVEESCPDHEGTIASVNGVVLFQSCLSDCELWKSDGTPAGTAPLRDIYPGPNDSSPTMLTTVGNRVFFAAREPDTGWALWKSDGSAEGTVRVATIAPGHRSGYSDTERYGHLSNFRAVGDALFFQACDSTTGCELWRSDGTPEGTGIVADIYPNHPSADAYPERLTRVGDLLFFRAYSTGDGFQLWRSDGTEDGTFAVRDVEPTTEEFVDVDGTLFFTAYDEDGSALWKSDGTPSGTTRVLPNPGGRAWYPTALTNVNGMLFFRASDGGGRFQLWRSDGTAEGTVHFADAGSVNGTYYRGLPAVIGDVVLFPACEPDCELWRTDLTTAGTMRVADLNPGLGSSNPRDGVVVDGELFFIACEPATGCEIWKSDGTTTGTTRVTDLVPGPSDANIGWMKESNGLLFFTVGMTYGHAELWRSDGTAAGTIRLADPFAEYLDGVTIDGVLFFGGCAPGNLHDCHVWRSNGTPAGTVPLFTPHPGSRSPGDFMTVGGALLFTTWVEGGGGYTLWTSDGTSEGTSVVDRPGNNNYRGPSWTVVGDRLFYLSDTQEHGAELWAVVPDGDPVEPGTQCDDGNSVDGDCCSSAGRFEPVGSACGDGNVCLDARCDGYGTCRSSEVSGGCDDGDRCTVADTCADGVCTGTDDVAACLDEFVCRRVSGAREAAFARKLTISDGIRSGTYDMSRPVELCTAAVMDGEPIVDAAIDLAGHRFPRGVPMRDTLERRTYTVTNRFETTTFEPVGSAGVLIPTSRASSGVPPLPSYESHEPEGYRCYTARPLGEASTSTRIVTIEDGFTRRPKQLEVTKPLRICVPVAMNSHAVKHPRRHLVCYRAKPLRADYGKRSKQFVSNWLGGGRVNVGKEGELCIPSILTP